MRKREPLQQGAHAIPVDVSGMRAARKPLMPDTPRLSVEARDGWVVRRDAEIPVVPAKLLSQEFLLHDERFMPIPPAVLSHSV